MEFFELVMGRSYKNVSGGYIIPRAKIPFKLSTYLIEFHTSPVPGVWRTSWKEIKGVELKKILGIGRNVKLIYTSNY